MDLSTTYNDLRSGVKEFRIWGALAYQDIQLRYARSLIGPFWISLSLIIMIVTLGFLYSEVFQQELSGYLRYLAAGLLVWSLIAGVLNDAGQMGPENTLMLRSVPINLTTLAMRIIARSLIIFAHNALAIFILLILFQNPIGWYLFGALPGIFVNTVILFQLVLILGPLSARFRDVPMIMGNLVQVAFFLTPIIWAPAQAGDRFFFVQANPFYHMLEVVRGPLLGEVPSLASWGFLGVVTVILSLIIICYLPKAKSSIFFWV